MKKIISTIAAAALLGTLCACEDKPARSEPVGDVTAPAATEAPTEPAYLELTEEDFAPVDMVQEITDGTPSAVHCTELEGVDFGERLSPCKAPDECEKYSPRTIFEGYPDIQEQYDRERQAKLETPSKGFVNNAVRLGGKLYFAVNFDDLCSRHDSSVFRYDPATKETTELVRREGLEYNGSFASLCAVHGRLFFTESAKSETPHTTICEIDPESGDVTELLSLDTNVYSLRESEDGMLITCYDGGDASAYYKEYIFETKELRDYKKTGGSIYDTVLCDGVPAEVTGGLVDGKYEPVTVKTQYYTISTDITSYAGIFLWRDKVCIATEDNFNGSWLYTYDIANRERLKMKFDGFISGLIKTKDALACISHNVGNDAYTVLYYIEPTLGTAFRVGKEEGMVMASGGDDAYVLTFRPVTEDGTLSNWSSGDGIGYNGYGSVFYSSSEPTVPDKLYTFGE